MRFGLLIYGDLATNTGGYLYDRMLVKGLMERGHEVRVVALTERPHLEDLEGDPDPELEHLLLDLNVDILLEDELCHPSLWNLNYSIRDQVPYDIVAVVHGLSRSWTRSQELRRSIERLEKPFLRSVDAFIFNSKYTRDEVKVLLGRSPNGVVAYPGKDHFTPPPLAEKDFTCTSLKLIHVANISDYKGLDILIEGLSGHSGFSLSVVGKVVDPSFFRYIQRLIEEERMEHMVEFLGPQSGEQLHQRLEAAHIFALPSFYESFGIAYIEALAHGLPIIGTNSGGIKEIITDGKEGFLVAPESPEMIARHLDEMQEDRRLLGRMSRSAVERYRSLPTWGETVNKIHEFLLDIEN